MFAIIMLISHTITDFIIQTKEIVDKKGNMEKEGYFDHGKGLLFTLIPILFFIKSDNLANLISRMIIILVIHLFVDFCKEKANKKFTDNKYSTVITVLIFVSDQVAHIIVIILVASNVNLEYNYLNQYLLDKIFINGGVTYNDMKILFVVLYVAFSGAYFIPLVFDIVYRKVNDYNKILNTKLKIDDVDADRFIDEVRTGRWIGILERILILIFLYTNQLASIGFIIAVKSLARFKMMENKIFSEYYLIGTLLSVVYTFVLYGFFQRML